MNIHKILANAVVLAGFAVVPFIPFIVLSSNTFFPFIVGKNFAFRIVVELMFSAWLVLAYIDPAYRPKKSYLLGAFVALLCVVTLSAIFGENPTKSFWSNFERMEGVVTYFHLFAYFIVASTVLSVRNLWRPYLNLHLAAGVIMAIYGVLQWAGDLTIVQDGARVNGTLGNAAYLGTYALINIFLAGFFMVRESFTTAGAQVRGAIYGSIILLQTFVLYHTATRGAMLGLIVGWLISSLLIIIFEKERMFWKKATALVPMGAVLVFCSGIFIPEIVRNFTLLGWGGLWAIPIIVVVFVVLKTALWRVLGSPTSILLRTTTWLISILLVPQILKLFFPYLNNWSPYYLFGAIKNGALDFVVGGILPVAVLVVIITFQRRDAERYAKEVALFLVAFFAGVFLLAGGVFATKNAQLVAKSQILSRVSGMVQKSPVLARFDAISLTEQTTKSRFMVWNMAYQGFKEHPMLGWGMENFNYVFNKYYDPKMYGQEQWFDRAHNVFFDWLIAGGLPALLAYLALFGAALWYVWGVIIFEAIGLFAGSLIVIAGIIRYLYPYMFMLVGIRASAVAVFIMCALLFGFAVRYLIRRDYKTPTPQLSIVEKSVLTGLLGGYFFQNLFVFDNLTSLIYFGTILAYIESMSRREVKSVYGRATKSADSKLKVESKKNTGDTEDITILVSGSALIIAFVLIYTVNYNGFKQNTTLINAMSRSAEGPVRNLALFKEAIAYDSFGTAEAREQLGQLSMNGFDKSKGVSDIQKQFISLAASELEKQAAVLPRDARYQIFAGSFLVRVGDVDKGLGYIIKASELSPAKQSILFELGNAYYGKKDLAKAEEVFKRAYDLAPEYESAEEYYIQILLANGKNDEVERVIKAHITRDPSFAQKGEELLRQLRK